jgi:hypothetical protein
MRLVSLVCGLFTSIIYLMDFLYLQQGLESRPYREIVYIYNACAVLCSEPYKAYRFISEFVTFLSI